jgi:hypothetical protein
LICCEQARHPSCAKLFHFQFFMQHISYTFFWNAYSLGNFIKNFITARYSILFILRDTDNISASDSSIKQTTWYNDFQFHMDAHDRCTNLGEKILPIVLPCMVEAEKILYHPRISRKLIACSNSYLGHG